MLSKKKPRKENFDSPFPEPVATLRVLTSFKQRVPAMQSPAQLTKILSVAPELSISEPEPGFPVIKVATKSSTATIALQGAQVLTWVPDGHLPVLYVSPRARYEAGVPFRGGIPVCWPWFSSHPDDPSLPQHGFARTRFWDLIHAESGAATAHLTFRLPLDEETRKMFPHDCEVTVHITVGDKLSVALKTKNTGDTPFQITSALHTYLTVGDIDRVQVEGIKECHYIDQLDGTSKFQETPVKIEEETDRIYRSVASVLMRDLGKKRSVFVDKSGSRSTVLWNPWIEKSKTIKDLPDRDYKEFVCIETANAGTDKPTVRPNRTHTLETVIGLRPLA